MSSILDRIQKNMGVTGKFVKIITENKVFFARVIAEGRLNVVVMGNCRAGIYSKDKIVFDDNINLPNKGVIETFEILNYNELCRMFDEKVKKMMTSFRGGIIKKFVEFLAQEYIRERADEWLKEKGIYKGYEK